MQTPGLEEARAAKDRARKIFAEKVEVVGVGITRIGDRYGLKINLAAEAPPSAELPTVVDGVPVKVEVVGAIRKQPKA